MDNGVYLERWDRIDYKRVKYLLNDPRYPNLPSYATCVPTFEQPSNWGDFFGSRLRTYFVPLETGNHYFYTCKPPVIAWKGLYQLNTCCGWWQQFIKCSNKGHPPPPFPFPFTPFTLNVVSPCSMHPISSSNSFERGVGGIIMNVIVSFWNMIKFKKERPFFESVPSRDCSTGSSILSLSFF